MLAQEFATRSLLLDDGQLDVHVMLGNLSNMRGHHDAALESYDKALEISPDDATTIFNRACTLDKMGDIDGAIEGFKKSTALDSSLPSTYLRNAVTKKLAQTVKK